jgi:hypothetical protein
MDSSSSYYWMGGWQVVLLRVLDLDVLVGASILALVVAALTGLTGSGGSIDSFVA